MDKRVDGEIKYKSKGVSLLNLKTSQLLLILAGLLIVVAFANLISMKRKKKGLNSL